MMHTTKFEITQSQDVHRDPLNPEETVSSTTISLDLTLSLIYSGDEPLVQELTDVLSKINERSSTERT